MKETNSRIKTRTKTARREERAVFLLLRFSALLTLTLLVSILGYVLVKGFYTKTEKTYPVTPEKELVLKTGSAPGEGVIFIANSRVRIAELAIYDLITIYTKPRRENWGFYTEQDLPVQAFIYKEGQEDVADYLLGDVESFPGHIIFVLSPEEMIERVSKTDGAIGFVPVQYNTAVTGEKGVKSVPLRLKTLAVHPSVMERENNRILEEISAQELEEVLSGRVKNWKELGGRDLPLTLLFPGAEPAGERSNGSKYPALSVTLRPEGSETSAAPSEEPAAPGGSDNSIDPGASGNSAAQEGWEKAETEAAWKDREKTESLLKLLAETPGAAALVPYREVRGEEIRILEITRVERKANLTLGFLLEPPARSGQWGGISYIILNTLLLILFTLLFSAPIGIAAALFLIEYSRQGPLVRILRLGTETLGGIPSIIFGIFGHIFFVQVLGMGIGFLSGTLTVTIMILPTLIRTSEEALKTVPVSLREGSLALGATKLQTIMRVTLPAASRGILTGVLLAIGRTVGETAVLIYTLGSSYELVRGASSSARVLSLHLYLLFSEAISFERAFATGAVLIFLVLIVNFLTSRLVGKMNRRFGN